MPAPIPDLRATAGLRTTSDFYFPAADSPEQAVALDPQVVGERIRALWTWLRSNRPRCSALVGPMAARCLWLRAH